MIILAKSKLPKVIDLFSGCGGLALGFQNAGFSIGHGIELVPSASWNNNYNLCIKNGERAVNLCCDITEFNEADFKTDIGKNGCIVIGGPPCQAYSLIGRAKLRSLNTDSTFLDDKRGYLFEDFLRFVLGLKANAVVMENVCQCTAFGKLNIPEIVCKTLEKHGYTAYWTVLNAADYGVPQVRERMILFAIKGKVDPILPVPSHSGKSYTEIHLTNNLKDFLKFKHFILPKQRLRKDPKWVTVEEAISDLPSLHRRATDRYTNFGINQQMDYAVEAQNEYQMKMRGKMETITGNVYRNTPRDYPIFARMKEGDNYTNAAKIAKDIFREKCLYEGVIPGTEEYNNLKKKTVPPYSVEKFISKWKKMDRNKPVYTLVAHLGVDTYSHIHPWEPRGISVREAARLQSFPDDYFFQSNMGDAFRQIGNSVPPLLAEAIAKTVRKLLEKRK